MMPVGFLVLTIGQLELPTSPATVRVWQSGAPKDDISNTIAMCIARGCPATVCY